MALNAKKNTRLTSFDDLKEIVIANTVKNVPEMKKEKKTIENKSLSEFS
ncbi:MAG: hypothetical protein AABY01_00100 [Nanoarchaeota archaeon]